MIRTDGNFRTFQTSNNPNVTLVTSDQMEDILVKGGLHRKRAHMQVVIQRNAGKGVSVYFQGKEYQLPENQ